MHNSITGIPVPSVDLEQAITDIIESIAIEENALSNILHSEGKLLQKAGNTSANIDEFVLLNESVKEIVKSTLRFQTLLEFELDDATELLKITGLLDGIDELEE